MPRFPPFPSPKPRQNAAHIYVPSHLTFVVRVDYEISTHQECLHVLLLVGHGELLHLYCISLFGDFLIWEKCITFYSRQKKIKQLLFILGSALDLRSLETHQKRLWNVMCSSNVSKNQPISPHQSSATTAMSFIWQILNLDLWMCSWRRNQLFPKLMVFRPYSSTQPLMFMIIHRLFHVIQWTSQS